jgi:hypothetical protein
MVPGLGRGGNHRQVDEREQPDPPPPGGERTLEELEAAEDLNQPTQELVQAEQAADADEADA